MLPILRIIRVRVPIAPSLGLLAILLLGACIAHAPEAFSGPDTLVFSGELPERPVRIEEDRWGIPHIRAKSQQDAAFALGLLHAEERLWQMDLARRTGLGRLSEVFGKRTLSIDKFLRTVGFHRSAQSAMDALPKAEVRLLEAYAAGVNAHIDEIDDLDELPPEYRILGLRPERWEPLHSVVWTKSMAWLLSSSAGLDVLEHHLVAERGEEVAAALLPDYPKDGPRILPPDQMKELRGVQPLDPRDIPGLNLNGLDLPESGPAPGPLRDPSGAAPIPEPSEAVAALNRLLGVGPTVGSNNWVVHGSRTKTGAPILSGDPHLGAQVPSIWYLVEIEAPGYHVVGATMPGLPGVVLGHNENIAWSVTNLGADVMDLILEREDPERPGFVLRPDGHEEILERDESILVRGRKRAVVHRVRSTSNGPLVGAFYKGFDDEPAMRWTALLPGDTTLLSFWEVGRAQNWDEFLEALRHYVVPSQNFVYADRQGHIGWKTPGRIPIREGFEGGRPGQGWLGDRWVGFIPFEELPEAKDPIRGWLATANNHPVPDDYPHHLGRRFSTPYRAARIIDLIEQGAGRSVAGQRAMQLDVLSPQPEELLPLLLGVEPRGRVQSLALELLRSWDGSHDLESGGAAVFNAWQVEVIDVLLAMHYPKRAPARQGGLSGVALRSILRGSAPGLCQSGPGSRHLRFESCEDLVAHAFGRAIRRLTRQLGRDVTTWAWGDLHKLRFHHRLAITPHLRAKLDTTVPSPGGNETVRIGSYRQNKPFEQTWLPSYRQVIDLSDWSKSGWVHSPGQSGVPWRAHYRDLVEPYSEGILLPMAFGREATAPFVVRERQLRR